MDFLVLSRKCNAYASRNLLQQMREKMSNFEGSLLRSVIEENKEMKKMLEAKEKEGEAIDVVES